jgi:hypothetical protein
VVVKIKTCPYRDEGLIGPKNSKSHFEKGKSGRTGCKDIAKRRSLQTNLWKLSQDLEK